jgi:transposase
MVTIGVDPHKRVHHAVAIDELGKPRGEWRGENSPAGWASLLSWAQSQAAEVQWGIEGAWSNGHGLAQYLVGQSETVYDVPPRQTASERGRGRGRSKNDARDGLAIARLVAREGASLTLVIAEDETAVLAVLVRERRGALAEATRVRNQLHALLTQCDPLYKEKVPELTSPAGIGAVRSYQVEGGSAAQQARAASVRRLGERLALLTTQTAELTKEISALGQARFCPLMAIKGIKGLTAGTLAGLLGCGQRFGREDQLASYAGIAPLEASSGGVVRHRLNRTGNRQLNTVVHRIALTQLHSLPAAKEYVARRQREGKSKREALRALKRYIIRAIWRAWQACWPAADQMVRSTAA